MGRTARPQEPRHAAVLTESAGWLTVERLPGHASELYPVETLWGNIKGQELANRCAQDLAELDKAVRGGMARVKQSPTLPLAFLKHAGLSLSLTILSLYYARFSNWLSLFRGPFHRTGN
jgi:hypothetical protein